MKMSQYRRDTEGRLSCSNLTYDKSDFSSTESVHDYPIKDGGEDGENMNNEPLGLKPYQYGPFGTVDRSSTMESGSEVCENEAAWRLSNTNWYVLIVERFPPC